MGWLDSKLMASKITSPGQRKLEGKLGPKYSSGGSRNLERGGSSTTAQSAPENFGVVTPTSGHVNALTTHVIIVTTDCYVAS